MRIRQIFKLFTKTFELQIDMDKALALFLIFWNLLGNLAIF